MSLAKQKKLTDSDRVLVALAEATEFETRAIPYEEIVICSWRRFPDRFSLRSHPEFPDSSDQHKKLYGPLTKAGYVVALKDKRFRLTASGLRQAQRLDKALGGQSAVLGEDSSRLDRDDERIVRSALASQAFLKWANGRRDEIVDFDARTFFRFSVATTKSERMLLVEKTFKAISKAGQASSEGAKELNDLAEYLSATYGQELGFIGSER